jgi:hypothetical protein
LSLFVLTAGLPARPFSAAVLPQHLLDGLDPSRQAEALK